MPSSRCCELENGELKVAPWPAEFNQPWLTETEQRPQVGRQVPPCSTGRIWPGRFRTTPRQVLLARARWLRETTGAKNLCIAGGVGAQLRRQRQDRARGGVRECLDPARGRRRRHRDRLRLLRTPGDSEEAALATCSTHAYFGRRVSRRGGRGRGEQADGPSGQHGDAQRRHLRRNRENSRRRQHHRLVPGPLRIRARARSATAASSRTRARPR